MLRWRTHLRVLCSTSLTARLHGGDNRAVFWDKNWTVLLISYVLILVYLVSFMTSFAPDFLRGRSSSVGVRNWPPNISRYRRPHWRHLLWHCAISAIQRNGRFCSQRRDWQIEILRGASHTLITGFSRRHGILDEAGMDTRPAGSSLRYNTAMGASWRYRGASLGVCDLWHLGCCYD